MIYYTGEYAHGASMIRIAIVEDNEIEAQQLFSCLRLFEKDCLHTFQVELFGNTTSFLDNYNNNFDILFLDIELPDINGMKAAFKIREFDKNVVIIFVTNMVKYAIKGYEVNALDYILKPVKYEKLLFKIQKAIEIVKANSESELTIVNKGTTTRLSLKNLVYIEVEGHSLTYHTTNGNIKGQGSLSTMEWELKSRNFMRCNSCYLVNPRYIESVKGFDLFMTNGDCLKISQPKKKVFMQAMSEWLGQGNR